MLREYPRVRESCNAIFGRPLVRSRHIPSEDCSYLKTCLEITSKSSARTYASPQVFFGAHWADPAAPSSNHRNPFRRYSENDFVIKYPST